MLRAQRSVWPYLPYKGYWLDLTVVEARNLKSSDTFSKNDPYVKIELPNSNQKFQVQYGILLPYVPEWVPKRLTMTRPAVAADQAQERCGKHCPVGGNLPVQHLGRTQDNAFSGPAARPRAPAAQAGRTGGAPAAGAHDAHMMRGIT